MLIATPTCATVPITYSWSFCSYNVRISMVFYHISLVRKWYYIIVSHIVFLILQLTDGNIQTNDHTIGFGVDVAVIWHVNITKNYRISHTV